MPILGKYGGLPARAEMALSGRDISVMDEDVYRPVARKAAAGTEMQCGAADCSGGWVMPWKRRGRPMFERQWGCGTRCLESLVRAAVRRERGEGVAREGNEPHRHRVPLGLMLLAQGWITHGQLQTALAAQRAGGRGRIGDWLKESCGIEEERITRGLGMQWNCPVLSLEGFSPVAMARVMPKRLVVEFGVVPLRVAGGGMLYFAFGEQPDAATALGVEQMCGLRVESGLLGAAEFASARERVLEADGVPVRKSGVTDADALTAAVVKLLEQRQPVAARLVRVHQYYWLRMFLESGAMSGVGDLAAGIEDVEDQLFVIADKKMPPA